MRAAVAVGLVVMVVMASLIAYLLLNQEGERTEEKPIIDDGITEVMAYYENEYPAVDYSYGNIALRETVLERWNGIYYNGTVWSHTYDSDMLTVKAEFHLTSYRYYVGDYTESYSGFTLTTCVSSASPVRSITYVVNGTGAKGWGNVRDVYVEDLSDGNDTFEYISELNVKYGKNNLVVRKNFDVHDVLWKMGICLHEDYWRSGEATPLTLPVYVIVETDEVVYRHAFNLTLTMEMYEPPLPSPEFEVIELNGTYYLNVTPTEVEYHICASSWKMDRDEWLEDFVIPEWATVVYVFYVKDGNLSYIGIAEKYTEVWPL